MADQKVYDLLETIADRLVKTERQVNRLECSEYAGQSALAATGIWDGVTGVANPTALVGLTVVNGVLSTAMRSDGAPPLDQTIVPTWTGKHLWQPSANATDVLKVVTSTGNVVIQVDTTNIRFGIGTIPEATVHSFSQTSQLRLGYDAGHYTDFLTAAGGGLTVTPIGNSVKFGITNGEVSPVTGYEVDLGSLQKKYRAIFAAELWVETLVAQDTMATIGGRILVGPTTVLTSDLAAIDTTIYVKHNQMVSGDRVYMEADMHVEFMSVDSAPSGTGPYTYTVTRNLDGTGADDWSAGDAVFNTGQTGNGFIDLYSVRGVKISTQYGPTIVGNVRNSATYNDWTEHWAIGNLRNLYDYGATNVYGFAAGKYESPGGAWISVDATNGFRVMCGSIMLGNWSIAGNITIGRVSAENILISSTAVSLRDGTTVYTTLEAGALTLGLVTAEHVIVDSSGVTLKDNTVVYGQFAATTVLGLSASEHISISATSVQLKDGSTVLTEIAGGVITVGQVAASESNIIISSGALLLRNNTTTLFQVQADGDVFIGEVVAGQSNVYISAAGYLSIRNYSTGRIILTAAGVLTINDSDGAAVFTFNASVGAEFTKPLTLAATGGIYQGTGTFASPTTGLKIWNSGTIGQIAGYNATVAQWYAHTDGKIYAGAGKVWMDATGLHFLTDTSALIQFESVAGTTRARIVTDYVSPDIFLEVSAGDISVAKNSNVTLASFAKPGNAAYLLLDAETGLGGNASQISLQVTAGGDSSIGLTASSIEITGNLTALKYILASSTAHTMQGRITASIATNGTLVVSSTYPVGLLIFQGSGSTGQSGIVGFASSATAVALILGSVGSVTKDTASNLNVYLESNVITLQNKTAAAITVSLLWIGTRGVLEG